MTAISALSGKGTAKGLIARLVELYDSNIIYDEINASHTNGKNTQQVLKESSSTVKTYDITYNASGDPDQVTNGTNTFQFTYSDKGEFLTMVEV